MAIDLVDLVRGYLTPDVIRNAAAYVGESSGATQKALAGIVPTLVGALANAASTKDGAQQLVRMLDAGQFDGSALSNVTSLFSGGTATQNALSSGRSILESLLGARTGDVGDVISRFAGVRAGSASLLLALAMPLVLHVLGRQRASVGSGASSLASLLGEQKSLLAGLTPAGLGAMLGWSGSTSGASELASKPVEAASRVLQDATETAAPVASRVSWVIPLAILGLCALVWLLWPTTTPTPVSQAVRKVSEVQLPDAVRISVPEGSLNFNLANWLAAGDDVNVPRRFVFDDLTFESGSIIPTSASDDEVNSLVAVLKAYPAVSVALEGYTDNRGDPISNKALSLDRAAAVREHMVKLGIAESRISYAGYGQENPIASNDTEEGRAKNRRLELVVMKR
jgi:OmpA-OmpF porin, OOP family